MKKKVLLFITLFIVIVIGEMIATGKPEECGYKADVARIAGHSIDDKPCECAGIVGERPPWVPLEVDLLDHTYCYGVKK